jgi:hypothetical protein
MIVKILLEMEKTERSNFYSMQIVNISYAVFDHA